MIDSLPVTLILEGVVGLAYSIWQKKPPGPILLTSIFANLITQSLLWVVLSLLFQTYLIALFTTEVVIWLIESAILYTVPANRLLLQEAVLLSLLLNLASFGLGWFLPV